MWEIAAEKVTAAGATLEFDRQGHAHRARRRRRVPRSSRSTATGREHTYPCTHVISSMPIGALCKAMDPPVDDAHAPKRPTELRYRDHLTVALVVPQKYSFPDNWIYVHDPDVEVGRVQNFGSWSPFMVKEGRTCLGLEFFVNEGDEHVDQARRRADRAGQARAPAPRADRRRRPASRPATSCACRRRIRCTTSTTRRTSTTMRKWLDANTPNVFPCGRNGMHKYNNQDHSMLTAMLSVENILGARPRRVGGERRGRVPRDTPATTRRSRRTGRDAPVLPRRALDEAARARGAEPKADATESE